MEKIRGWNSPCGKFRLEMYDTFIRDGRGGTYIAYEFFSNGVLIFEGDSFSPSPMYGIDSDETVAGLLSFLCIRPGDADREYFEHYTQEQLEFAHQYGEELDCCAMRLENAAN